MLELAIRRGQARSLLTKPMQQVLRVLGSFGFCSAPISRPGGRRPASAARRCLGRRSGRQDRGQRQAPRRLPSLAMADFLDRWLAGLARRPRRRISAIWTDIGICSIPPARTLHLRVGGGINHPLTSTLQYPQRVMVGIRARPGAGGAGTREVDGQEGSGYRVAQQGSQFGRD
jgi:hypothetical protein